MTRRLIGTNGSCSSANKEVIDKERKELKENLELTDWRLRILLREQVEGAFREAKRNFGMS